MCGNTLCVLRGSPVLSCSGRRTASHTCATGLHKRLQLQSHMNLVDPPLKSKGCGAFFGRLSRLHRRAVLLPLPMEMRKETHLGDAPAQHTEQEHEAQASLRTHKLGSWIRGMRSRIDPKRVVLANLNYEILPEYRNYSPEHNTATGRLFEELLSIALSTVSTKINHSILYRR